DGPAGIAVNDSCQVFISDYFNDRMQRMGIPPPNNGPPFILTWGQYCEENCLPGQFIEMDALELKPWAIYTGELSMNRVQKFDTHGTPLLMWGSLGTGPGQFNQVTGIAVDGSGNVFVSDNANHRIQKFDQNGTYISQFGTFGTGAGQLQYPRGLACDA